MSEQHIEWRGFNRVTFVQDGIGYRAEKSDDGSVVLLFRMPELDADHPEPVVTEADRVFLRVQGIAVDE